MTVEVAINPGAGPVAGASEQDAVENMHHFITDCKQDSVDCIRIPKYDYGEGRFAFLLWMDNRCYEIQMPGLPLEKVRYMGSDSQDIWDFPRLYVDGSSWAWKFAILDEEEDWK